MEDRLGLHIFFKFLALKTISLWTFICLEVYFLPMPPGLELRKIFWVWAKKFFVGVNSDFLKSVDTFKNYQKFIYASTHAEHRSLELIHFKKSLLTLTNGLKSFMTKKFMF